jgi:hypothetical protein
VKRTIRSPEEEKVTGKVVSFTGLVEQNSRPKAGEKLGLAKIKVGQN